MNESAIRLCGRFDVRLHGAQVTQSLPGRQGRLLLAYLACNRAGAVGRDELVDVLWPSRQPAQPDAVLGALLSKLRRVLGASAIQGRREVTLVLPADTSIDLEDASSAIEDAEASLGDGMARRAFDHAQAARELLVGEFLPGEEDPWVEERRRDVEDLRLRALEVIARAGLTLAGAQLATAEAASRRLIDAEPLRERGHRLLMQVLATGGDVAAALQVYEELRLKLRDELGATPGAATRAVHTRLLSDGRRSAPGDAEPPRRSDGRARIVASKVAVPVLRPGIVERPALVDGLLALAHAPVVVLSAPAGYGKTTLLAQWRARDERPFAWVSLDAGDNDPVALTAAVLGALDPVLGLDEAILDALTVAEPPIQEVILPALVDRCFDAGQPFVLVLDDLHRVTAAGSHAVVDYLVQRIPSGCQLALATRTEPPLPLATLRAQGRLAELRSPDLALADAEAEALLGVARVELTDDQLTRLMQRTEGWPAAVYLATMALRDRAGAEDLLQRFTGTTRHVADFLTEAVLGRLPHDVIEFLLRTSVLDELTGPLCDAVTEVGGSQDILLELERTNLFVVPLDEDRRAYRYHHLFAQYLRADLASREPEIVQELHRRAWRWYHENGLTGRAVVHAQAAGDFDVAADFFAASWLAMSERGQIETLRSWLAGFDDHHIEARPPLAIAAAWVTALAGEPDRAMQYAVAARSGVWHGPMPDGSASLESGLAIMSSSFGLGGLTDMRAAAARAVELEGSTSPWRPLALFLVGLASTLQGDLESARGALEEAVSLVGDEVVIGVASLAYLAVGALRGGAEERAWRYAQRSVAVAERPRLRNYVPSVATFGVVAHLATLRGDLEAARLAVQRAEELLPRASEAYWWLMIETRIQLAPALAALGRTDEAAERLDEAAELLEQHADAGALPEWHRQAVRALAGDRSVSQERHGGTRGDIDFIRDDVDGAQIVPFKARRGQRGGG